MLCECGCGEEFEPKTDHQRYVDDSHRKREERRRYKARKRELAKVEKAVTSVPVEARSLSDAEVEKALTYLAHTGGNGKRASEALEEQEGIKVKAQTLRKWARDRHRDRYLALVQQIEPQMKVARASEHEFVADEYVGAQRKALEQLHSALDAGEVPVHKLDGLARNAAIGAGVNRDKGAQLRGEATSVVLHQSAKEIERKLRGLGIVIDGDAVEIKDQPQLQGESA